MLDIDYEPLETESEIIATLTEAIEIFVQKSVRIDTQIEQHKKQYADYTCISDIIFFLAFVPLFILINIPIQRYVWSGDDPFIIDLIMSVMIGSVIGGGGAVIMSLFIAAGASEIKKIFKPAKKLLSYINLFQSEKEKNEQLKQNFINTDNFRFQLLLILDQEIEHIDKNYNTEFIEYLQKNEDSPFTFKDKLKTFYQENNYDKIWLLAQKIIALPTFIKATFEHFNGLSAVDKSYLDTTYQIWLKEYKNKDSNMQKILKKAL